MRRTYVLVLLSLLVAGCASPEVAPAATVPDATPVELPRPEVQVPAFLDPILLGTIVLGSEPNVGVAQDGTVYVATPLALWRSDDAGDTFQPIGEPGCFLGLPGCPVADGSNPGLKGGGDGAVAVDDNGTVYWAGLAGGEDGAVPFQWSADRGESWSEPYDPAVGNSSDREWLSINRTGSVFVQWRDFGSGERVADLEDVPALAAADNTTGILVKVTDDGGKTWRDTVRVGDDGHQGPIAHDPTSAWMYLPHVTGPSGSQLVVARSSDGGASWEDVEAAPLASDTYQFPIAAVDGNGTAYVLYVTGTLAPTGEYLQDRLVNTPAAFLVVSHDHGATWSAPLQVSPQGVPVVFPWIVAGDAGRIAMAWYEGTLPAPMASPNVWHVAVVMSTTADQDAPAFAGSYVSASPNHVGHICVVGSACGPQDRSLLDFFEIRMLPDGTPVLAFVGDADVKMATVKVYATKMTEGTKLLAEPVAG